MGTVSELLLDTLEDLVDANLHKFHWYLTKGNVLKGFPHIPKSQLEKASRLETVEKMVCKYQNHGAVELTLEILSKMKQNQLSEDLRTKLEATAFFSSSPAARPSDGASANANALSKGEVDHAIKQSLKTSFKKKFVKLYEGTVLEGDHILLNDIFTELYVIKGCTGGVYNEHEVRQVEAFHPRMDETPIQFSDIFKAQSGETHNAKKVLTIGIAGVGKTVSVHKFILDWAEDKSNQDVDFILFMPFRELNLIRHERYTLQELVVYFHHELGESFAKIFSEENRLAFIFDGLDECRIPLNFNEKKISSLSESTTIDKLVTSLIKGELLPSALIWITSRPAAANQIPRRYFDHMTEIRGFTEQQKEAYFRKRICDQDKACRIYSHIKSSRSLHILCHIPVFCWIAASVLLQIQKDGTEMEHAPTTLTEMYIRFLLFQMTQMTEKYDGTRDRGVVSQDILKLAKLAFLQLQKGQLIFYKEDLKDCGIDVAQALVYSGVCTQIFRKNEVIFTFVHLSFQEFLAALYVFLTFSAEWNPFVQSFWEKFKWRAWHSLCDLHKTAVNKALQSENGHLDLFLRFLLGLSLPSNQRLLKSLQPPRQLREESLTKTSECIKRQINESKCVERCINLFHCLSELKDNSLVATVQNYLRSGGTNSTQALSPGQWSALAFVLLTSEETQERFELKKYRGSDEGLRRLLGVVKQTRRAALDHCNLSLESCKLLATVLISDSSPLRELDLSQNNLLDSEVEPLLVGLKNHCCKLEILRLCCCGLTQECCETLASALSSGSSVLKELDLSYNELKNQGVKLLSAGLENPCCKLEILRLALCMITKDGCSSLASALLSNPSHLKELDLRYNHPGVSGKKVLSARQEDPRCSLKNLKLDHGGAFRTKPGPRKYACKLTLDQNTAHKNISLSENCRKASRVPADQLHPEHPERFEGHPHSQVLCRESMTGRCYWEAEWEEWCEVAVAYKGIGRKEKNADACGFGSNEKSWSLNCSKYRCSVSHNKKNTDIPVPTSKRVGVYLDWPAGSLTFYSVHEQNKRNPIHTFHCRFTEPLYAGFGVYNYNAAGTYVSSVSICQIEEEECVSVNNE
ncbi:NACHT, LRR and PYD domains-containing protein 3-like [Salminus brasiliensis]|uniref:NACHT, LRR and PYD domains-containing protein 3-like n=1 Tax=Salminus brasiliensis TaxID=930266 RepID=UPI003B832594